MVGRHRRDLGPGPAESVGQYGSGQRRLRQKDPIPRLHVQGVGQGFSHKFLRQHVHVQPELALRGRRRGRSHRGHFHVSRNQRPAIAALFFEALGQHSYRVAAGEHKPIIRARKRLLQGLIQLAGVLGRRDGDGGVVIDPGAFRLQQAGEGCGLVGRAGVDDPETPEPASRHASFSCAIWARMAAAPAARASAARSRPSSAASPRGARPSTSISRLPSNAATRPCRCT